MLYISASKTAQTSRRFILSSCILNSSSTKTKDTVKAMFKKYKIYSYTKLGVSRNKHTLFWAVVLKISEAFNIIQKDIK